MEVIKEKYTPEDLWELCVLGIAHENVWPPGNRNFAISTWLITEKKIPLWLTIRVDPQDGVPWRWNITFKIENLRISGTTIKKRAKGAGLGENTPFGIYEASEHQSFGPGRVLQVQCLNEKPRAFLKFLKALEPTLGKILNRLTVLLPCAVFDRASLENPKEKYVLIFFLFSVKGNVEDAWVPKEDLRIPSQPFPDPFDAVGRMLIAKVAKIPKGKKYFLAEINDQGDPRLIKVPLENLRPS